MAAESVKSKNAILDFLLRRGIVGQAELVAKFAGIQLATGGGTSLARELRALQRDGLIVRREGPGGAVYLATIYLTGRQQFGRPWQRYVGLAGRRGWRSNQSERILYREEMPGSHEHEGPSDGELAAVPQDTEYRRARLKLRSAKTTGNTSA